MPFGNNNGMTLKIDSAGRIVVPKSVRERLGLEAGSELDLSEDNGRLLLEPIDRKPSLVKRDGLLVHRGRLPRGYEWTRLVDADREERLRTLASW